MDNSDSTVEDLIGDVRYTDSQKTIEDLVGDVRYTDSQKSGSTSVQYAKEYRSIRTLSSRDTYIIDRESSFSEQSSYSPEALCYSPPGGTYDRTSPLSEYESNPTCQFVAQETFTQTSKTIFELVELDGKVRKIVDTQNLETQTSTISVKQQSVITENKTIQYSLEVNDHANFKEIFDSNKLKVQSDYTLVTGKAVKPALTDSLQMQVSDVTDDCNTKVGFNTLNESENNIEPILESGEIRDMWKEKEEVKNTLSEFESSFDTDIDEDSLMERRDNDETHKDKNSLLKLFDYESVKIPFTQTFKDLASNVIPESEKFAQNKHHHDDVHDKIGILFKPHALTVNQFKESHYKTVDETDNYCKSTIVNSQIDSMSTENSEPFKLPPIKNQSAPCSPHMNSLFTVNYSTNLYKPNTLNNLDEASAKFFHKCDERRMFENHDLASGEGSQISDFSEKPKKAYQLLPPINNSESAMHAKPLTASLKMKLTEKTSGSISIREKIKELKVNSNPQKSHSISTNVAERASSADKSLLTASDFSKISEVTERTCEMLCLDFIKKLNSSSWIDVIDTLEDMPRILEKFWNVITEQRIADLLRLICQHADSPRAQVAKSACKIIATIVKATNYTKKPDFYECVSLLLAKTGSYSRPLRRAANLALDEIVCSVELSHSVTALCIHGASHKNSLVRCATARLLVVCCALGRGGRELLRARPVSSVTARKFAMRALSMLLEDRNSDVRKYAERLYSMLRPLPNFEAFFLSDLDLDTATQQIKRYDKLLLCGPSKEVS